MNKNMSFTQYQKKYITSFECQYDTMSTWGFYINIENNDKNVNDKNVNDKNDNDKNVNDKNDNDKNDNDKNDNDKNDNDKNDNDKNDIVVEYINQTFFNCLLKTAPCIMMFYCFT